MIIRVGAYGESSLYYWESLITIIYYNASCIAHIVNLATQALINAHTKSKHYDPSKPDEDLVADSISSFDRDEVGLVRSIAVKVYFSLSRVQVAVKPVNNLL